MRTELDVVNSCLASMGELPLNSLAEPHAFRGAAQSKLARISDRVQSQGWWFNLENVTLTPNIIDSYVYLPGDTLAIRAENRDLVQRNDRLFDLSSGSYIFGEDQTLVVIRRIPFEDLDAVSQNFIEAETVLSFQKDYDGDSTKSRELKQERDEAWVAFKTVGGRAAHGNMLTSNARLMQLKGMWRSIRYPRR